MRQSGRIEIANNAGTPAQDAFAGGEYNAKLPTTELFADISRHLIRIGHGQGRAELQTSMFVHFDGGRVPWPAW